MSSICIWHPHFLLVWITMENQSNNRHLLLNFITVSHLIVASIDRQEGQEVTLMSARNPSKLLNTALLVL
jgi:hypothetical protein